MRYSATLIAALIVALCTASANAAVREPTYLIFSIMGPQAFGSKIINGIVQPQPLWKATEKNAVEEIRKEFGEQRAGQGKYVGFSICLTPTLNLKPEQLKAEVVSALDLAEINRIPVFFHLDDEHFLWDNPEISQHVDAAEWSDFPRSGETCGPVVPRYWVNWGDPASAFPVPPACFACHPLRATMSRRLKECIAEPIVQRLHNWKRQGKDYLFAGLASGNETKVPDFSHGYEGYSGAPGEEAGMDMTKFPPVRVRMTKEEHVPIGYHSLAVMGYNQQSIERLAQSQHKTVRRIVHELLFDAAHDYAEFQSKTLNQAGLPRDRLYTHFTSTNYTMKSFEDQVRELEERPASSGRAGSENLAPPIRSAVNQFSRPGFTVVRSGVDLNELVAQLQKAGAPEGGKAWAAVESYACTGQPGVPQTKRQYEEYLGGLISHGAKIVNCYGWNIPNGPYAVKASGVIPAAKAWIAGEQLPSNWNHSQEQTRQCAIQSKLAHLQETARDSVNSGRDPHLVQAVLETFSKEVEPLMRNAKLTEAEACIDRSISRLKALK